VRILDLTSDPYLAPIERPGVVVTCLPVGKPVSPWPALRAIPRGAPWKVAIHLLRARFGGYDWVILPPVHVRRVIDNGIAKRSVKALVRGWARSSLLCRLSRRVLFGTRCRYGVCDASDLRSPSAEFSRFVGATVYFKRNLAADRFPDTVVEWHPLPMPVPDEWLDEAASDGTPKPSDYFSAGEYNSEARILLRDVGRALMRSGWRVDLLDERVDQPMFWKRMAAAKLCAAAEGYGYHSWRMYEAAGLGCVPVLNPPPARLWSWFEDGRNCLFSEPGVEATAAKIDGLLRDPEKIREMAAEARAQVDKWHRSSANAARMLAVLERIGSGTRNRPNHRRWRWCRRC
jgi:hypothetical protein